jgi:hypothetical protein
MTTFFKRFPARRNRTVHSGLILELFAQWVIYFDWKKKFAGLGGVKGGLREYILHSPPRGSKICFLAKKNEFLRTKIKDILAQLTNAINIKVLVDGRGSVLDHSNQSDRFLLCTLLVSQCIFC